MFESEGLVFIRQLPQVALNAVLLDSILIALVNEKISWVAAAERLQGSNALLKCFGAGDGEGCFLQFGANVCRRFAQGGLACPGGC